MAINCINLIVHFSDIVIFSSLYIYVLLSCNRIKWLNKLADIELVGESFAFAVN